MKKQRLVVLGLALVAACCAAFLARGLLGGGTPKVEAKPTPPVAMSRVLVASGDLQPGQQLTPSVVRWEKWPSASVNAGFIIERPGLSIDAAIKGTVVRAPMVSGEPLTTTKIVHADAAGFMAAMLSPGMRAVSITITTDSGAGGFILPNDRIDLILTQKINDSPPRVRARAILHDIRVLAIDQTVSQDKDQKSVLGKTATLELTPEQALIVARAEQQGALALSLRALGDSNAALADAAPPPLSGGGDASEDGNETPTVAVIRYGITRPDPANGQKDQGR